MNDGMILDITDNDKFEERKENGCGLSCLVLAELATRAGFPSDTFNVRTCNNFAG